MRVAHIITRLIIGGAQENTLLTCEDLSQIYGDDVLLIAGPPEGPEGSLVHRAEQGPYCFEQVNELRRSVLPCHDLSAYIHIKKILRKFKPDVVHTHSAKAGILGRFAARSLGTPVIIHSIHGTPFHPNQHPLARCLIRRAERMGAKRCDAFISVANAMSQTFLASKIVLPEEVTTKPFFTIRSGMDVNPFLHCDVYRAEIRQKYGFTQDDIVVGKIARLFRLKGHDDLIAAASHIKKLSTTLSKHLKFMLVGDGVLHDSLQKRIESLGLTDMFVFTGLVPPDEIPRMISAMDMVVHTSLREGLARVLPQALIAGRPVISYDIDGAREVCITGQTGFLVPPRDTSQIAAAITQLAQTPELRKKMGEEGRRRFTEEFRHEHMTAEIRKVYQRILEKKAFSENS
ncbi:MAG: glycosyltransferase family 4 protein [Thermoguttaceae bacterium]|nr:glycosyltransferase family 4 protein [Thermoguttaceae bacterium]